MSPVILRERITDFKPKTKPVKLPVNIVYRCCPAKSALDDRFNDYHSLSTSSATSLTFELDRHRHGIIGLTSKRPLVLILAWMLAKETHIDKYREFWFKRGCDVLSVRTSPLALLLPNIGGRQNAVHVYDFIANFRPSYEKIIVHAFSVGGYQLSEILHMLDHNVLNGDKLARKIYDSLKAIIIDSCVYPEEAPSGLSRAITKNPIVQPLIEKSIYNFLTLTKSFTRDRYIEVEKHLFANRNKIPGNSYFRLSKTIIIFLKLSLGLVLYSEDDLVSSVKLNEKLYQSWNSKGVVVDFQCWQNSIHVLHYREHKNEYEQKVDQFLSKINISK